MGTTIRARTSRKLPGLPAKQDLGTRDRRCRRANLRKERVAREGPGRPFGVPGPNAPVDGAVTPCGPLFFLRCATEPRDRPRAWAVIPIRVFCPEPPAPKPRPGGGPGDGEGRPERERKERLRLPAGDGKADRRDEEKGMGKETMGAGRSATLGALQGKTCIASRRRLVPVCGRAAGLFIGRPLVPEWQADLAQRLAGVPHVTQSHGCLGDREDRKAGE